MSDQRLRLSHSQYRKICDYLNALQNGGKIDQNVIELTQAAQKHLEFPMSDKSIRRACKDLDIEIKRAPTERAPGRTTAMEQELELHAKRLRWLEYNINKMAEALGYDFHKEG